MGMKITSGEQPATNCCYNAFMVLSIPISVEAETRLRALATAAGVEVETYAARLLERVAAPPKSTEELSGPLYDEFLASGMTDDELGEFLEEVKHDMRRERRRRQAS